MRISRILTKSVRDYLLHLMGEAMDLRIAKRSIRHFMSVQSDNPELLKAQYRAFTRQMPMMYFILL